jgi:hypothetical protein
VLVQGRGVLCGYSAAESLDTGCGPPDAETEVLLPESDCRRHTGLRARSGRLFADEVCVVDGAEVARKSAAIGTAAPREGLWRPGHHDHTPA